MLEAPITLRAPRTDEIPNYPEALELLKTRENANIVEGFKLVYNTSHDLPFKYFVEINIDNSRLWDLIKALINNMPEVLSCIYHVYEQEPNYSPYDSKKNIFEQLEKYELELTQDCNIEFGLIYQTDALLEEIFVKDTKYIQIWGTNEIALKKIMSDFGIIEMNDLNFFDEFPKVVLPLTMFDDKAKRSEIVIKELKDYFISSELMKLQTNKN